MLRKFPYNWAPAAHQLEFMANPARFKVGVWHRKAWKTTMAINELIRWSAAVPGTYWYICPFMSQAKKVVWNEPEMLAKFLPPEIWAQRNNTELLIPFPNGSVLYILGADHPDSLRGPNPKGVVLDEYDDMRPEMWSAVIQPIMTANPDAWTWFIGTYKGRKDLFAKYNYAKDANGWHCSLLKASKSGIIPQAALEEAKNTTTKDFYLQEYECEAIEGAGSFFRRIMENVYEGLIEPNITHRYQGGVDLAKYNDYSVLTAVDLCTFKVAKPERFSQIDYNLQKSRIESFYLRWGKPRIFLDSTGVGEPIFDDLTYQKIARLESFKFTEHSRRDLLVNLQVLIEQDKIKLPNDETLLDELKSMQYVLGDMGKVKIEVPDSVHDDCIMSLALATWQFPDHPLPLKNTTEELEALTQFDYYKNRPSRYSRSRPYLRYKN
jgi:hypothetical protein